MLYLPDIDSQIEFENPDFSLLTTEQKQRIVSAILATGYCSLMGGWRPEHIPPHGDTYISNYGSVNTFIGGADYATYRRTCKAAHALIRRAHDGITKLILGDL